MRDHRWIWTALVALSIGALAFAYRFNTLGGSLAGFDNDHFFQIVRAEAMLEGELSLRDYSDAELRSLWPQLTYASSAAAMTVMGHSLRSEAILGVGMLAVGAAAIVWASATISGALLPAALAALLAIGLSPTLYNYPKIVLYVFAVIVFVAYARRPSTRLLIVIAGIEVIATLYRHDYGVYLGIATATLLLCVHRRAVVRPIVRFAAIVLVGLAPGMLFVQQHGGVLKYVRECLETSRREIGRTAAPRLQFTIDWSQPFVERALAPAAPPPRIAVRWAGLGDADRAHAAQQLGLADPQPRADDQNWSYAIDAPTAQRLAAIVKDPRVSDTDGIDRQTFALTSPPSPAPPRAGVFGWRIAPGVLRQSNAGPWLRLVAWGVVGASFICLFALFRRPVDPDAPLAAIAATATLGAVLCFVFLRNAADYRLADASVPIVILGSWLLTTVPRLARAGPASIRIATWSVLVLATAISVLSVGVVGTVPEQITGTGLYKGLSGITSRSRELWRTLGNLPDSLAGIDEHLATTALYLRRCTLPSDRLLVAANLPEVYYFARRRIAAGQMVFFGGFYTSDDAQREEIARWVRQDVPIALVESGERFDAEFASDYPLLTDYLRTRYRKAGTLAVERGAMLDVWVDRSVKTAADAETGLPCEVQR